MKRYTLNKRKAAKINFQVLFYVPVFFFKVLA